MILAIMNNKGGVAKTATCTNLGAVLYQEGRRVLLVDTDDQGDIADTFGINPDALENTIYEALTEQAHVSNCIYRMAGGDRPDDPCLDILPAGNEMATFELEILSDPGNWAIRFDYVRRVLSRVMGDYDVILIDTPPTMGLILGNVLMAATGVVVPYLPEKHTMRSLEKVLQQVSGFQERNSRLNFVGLFGSMVDKRIKQHAEVMRQTREFSKTGGFIMYETQIMRAARFSNAVAYDKLPLALADPKDKHVKAFRELWREIEANSRNGLTRRQTR